MMSEVLLRKYIELLSERIRTDREKQNNRWGNFEDQQKFNLNFFKKLETSKSQDLYAAEFLSHLGQGSSRTTYLLNSRQVLKIARNERGLAQNEAEVDLFTNPKTKPIVTKIFDFNKDYKWVLSEAVREFTEIEEFEDATDTDWTDLNDDIHRYNRYPVTKLGELVLHLMSVTNLLPSDLTSIGHWGLTASGKVVILDYGFTADVLEKHY